MLSKENSVAIVCLGHTAKTAKISHPPAQRDTKGSREHVLQNLLELLVGCG
jgi:hypothetical protein